MSYVQYLVLLFLRSGEFSLLDKATEFFFKPKKYAFMYRFATTMKKLTNCNIRNEFLFLFF